MLSLCSLLIASPCLQGHEIEFLGTVGDLAQVLSTPNCELTVDPTLKGIIFWYRGSKRLIFTDDRLVASAMQSKWQRTEAGWCLEPVHKWNAAHVAPLSTMIRNAQDSASRKWIGPPASNYKAIAQRIEHELARSEHSDPFYVQSSIDYLAADLLKSVDAKQLARLEPYTNRVFSNRPTIAENPFSNGQLLSIEYSQKAQLELERLLRESGGWASASRIPGMFFNDPLGRIVFSIGYGPRGLTSSLRIYTSAGALVAEGGEGAPWARAKGEEMQDLPKSTVTMPNEVSLAKSMLEQYTEAPDQLEPARLVVDSLSRSLAESDQVACVLTDQLVTSLLQTKGNISWRQIGIKAEGAGARLQWKRGLLSFVLNDAVIPPQYQCLDRVSLRQLLNSLRRKEDYLGNVARFHYSTGTTSLMSQLDDHLINKSNEYFGIDAPPITANHHFLCLIGNLPKNAFSNLLEGKPVLLQGDSVGHSLKCWADMSELYPSRMTSDWIDCMSMPTYSFPSGLPNTATVAMASHAEFLVRSTGQPGPPIPLQDVAQYLVSSKVSPNEVEVEKALRSTSRPGWSPPFNLFTRESGLFQVFIGGLTKLETHQVQGGANLVKGQVSIEQLPEGAKRELLGAMRRLYGESMPTTQGVGGF